MNSHIRLPNGVGDAQCELVFFQGEKELASFNLKSRILDMPFEEVETFIQKLNNREYASLVLNWERDGNYSVASHCLRARRMPGGAYKCALSCTFGKFPVTFETNLYIDVEVLLNIAYQLLNYCTVSQTSL